MEVTYKRFSELTTKELYEILQLRSAVFVVEQDCVYQDIDDKDQQAIHICGHKDDCLVAYTRIFKPGDYFEATSIGRVVVRITARKHGCGKEIMLKTLDYILKNKFDEKITLSAQRYLIPFYEGLGFNTIGKGYLEDGIPHIKMVKKK